ncbi:MAG: ATP-binding protein [Acidobacteriota bacterium]
MKNSSLELTFGSQLQYLEIVQDVSDNISRLVGFDDDARYWISLSVRESVINAILHGNHQDERKRVGVSFTIASDRLVISIQDEGQGFEESKLPDPLDPNNLLKPSGRGIFYVRSFMDEVRYRVRPEGGLEVTMEKRLNHKQGGEKK